MSVTSVSFSERPATEPHSPTERAAERTEALSYMPQLDAVRAIAIFMVMLCHLYPGPITTQAGGQGVTLFFVLSGFLITGILLKCRTYVHRDGQSRLFTLRQFYIRRFLRIFPLYYLVLAVLWLIHDPTVRAHPGWHLAYLTNVLGSIESAHHYFPPKSTGHLWSLAVEEQFYLVWPWLMLFLPRKLLAWAVGALIIGASVFRVAVLSLGWQYVTVVHLTTFWLDALGLGALLAIAVDPSFGLRQYVARGRAVALVAGAACLLLVYYLQHVQRHFTVMETLRPVGYSLVFVWLIARAAEGFKGWTGRVMSWKPVLWIGAISYGIYVYHYILRNYQITHPNLPQISSPALNALALSAISIAIAAISFYLYERPINQLRRYFDYRASAKAPLRPPAR